MISKVLVDDHRERDSTIFDWSIQIYVRTWI